VPRERVPQGGDDTHPLAADEDVDARAVRAEDAAAGTCRAVGRRELADSASFERLGQALQGEHGDATVRSVKESTRITFRSGTRQLNWSKYIRIYHSASARGSKL
jgi:hypothetical protein